MKKPELLAPAGNIASLKAAITAGCDAVYLGGCVFGARSFADNFSNDELIEVIKYAHLYGVRVYVTVNTLIYENEVETFINYIDFLYRSNADAVIMQDIGMIDLVRKTYPNLEIHASTQMHIHNLEGVQFVKELGLKRVVIARETSYLDIKKIKENVDIQLEVFVHGALCISYSGQCLMSSLIGNRSGNRGTCAGSCRQKYDLIVALDEGLKKVNNQEYLLSSKDLNSLENIGQLIDIGVDSFKIEGRMKSPSYVYSVVSLYRKAIDSYVQFGEVKITNQDIINLKKIFNREFTKGFLFNDRNIINPYRPNHIGIVIGKVINAKNNRVTIKLEKDLCVQDGIRIIGEVDKGCIVTTMFKNGEKVLIAKSNDIITIVMKDKVKVNSKVVKTTDVNLNMEIANILKSNDRKVKVSVKIEVYINKPMKLILNDGINDVLVYGEIVTKSKNNPVSYERIIGQIKKMGETVYEVNKIDIIGDQDIFIPIKCLNELRRKAVDLLNDKRLIKNDYHKESYSITVPDFEKSQDFVILVNDDIQYERFKDYNFKNIYIDSELFHKIDDDRKVLKLERVINSFKDYNNKLLVGELGSVYKYKNCITDFSLNVVNSYSVAFLHSLNVSKVTLSYELNYEQIKNLIDAYINRYNKRPNLELIVFGKEEVMISKFNMLKYFGIDNNKTAFLKDRFHNLYPIMIKNNLMHIHNFKTRDISDYDKYFNVGINSIRFNVVDLEDARKLREICAEINL